MTAGTVVITGGILATVILLCIIAVLCYCRLQVRLSLAAVLFMCLLFSVFLVGIMLCFGTFSSFRK